MFSLYSRSQWTGVTNVCFIALLLIITLDNVVLDINDFIALQNINISRNVRKRVNAAYMCNLFQQFTKIRK